MEVDTSPRGGRLRARMLAIAALMVLYGAVDARQPAVRVAVPLPVPARSIAEALDLPAADSATLLLTVARLLYEHPTGQDATSDRRRVALRQALWTPGEKGTDKVPLPLDPAIWRETILESQPPDHHLVAAITNNRQMTLLYYGLSALDDETLGWLGADRATLEHVRGRAGMFAAFGRSVRVRGARVAVPGGDPAGPLWTEVVGVEPAKAGAFVQKLFRGNGRLAYLYDTIAHLDPARQRFALGLHLPEEWRAIRLRALLDVFANAAPEWRVDDRPFARPPLDGAVVLSTILVDADGGPAGPSDRRLWDAVLRGDEKIDVAYTAVGLDQATAANRGQLDAARIVSRIAQAPYSVARRRLDAYLFAQRVFEAVPGDDDVLETLANAIRSAIAFPALALTLERLEIRDPAVYVAAARHAAALGAMAASPSGESALTIFQGALAILERAHGRGGLPARAAQSLVLSLVRIEPSGDTQYAQTLAQWVSTDLVQALPALDADAPEPKEAALLAVMAGVTPDAAEAASLEWEGQRYRVDPAAAEFRRLRRVREQQGGASLDTAVADALQPGQAGEAARRTLADTLASIAYAAHLGDPDGQAVKSGNVALRHDFQFGAWRLPSEDFAGAGGWRVRGSLLALETALGRLSLRRLDPTAMPGEPQIPTNELQTLMMTAALFNPREMTDAARDEIAAAVNRGRARAAALTGDRQELDRAAGDAGLDEWERQALAWTAEHDPGHLLDRFGPLQLFWLGAPRPALAGALKSWGVAARPLSGCVCLEMPPARAASDLTGRPTAGIVATGYADVAVKVADALKSLEVPAAVAPGVLQFALQETIDHTKPAHAADTAAFARAAAALSRNQIIDYIAALTAGGALIPETATRHNSSR